MNYKERMSLDNWLAAAFPDEEVDCPDCGDDGGEPNPECPTCEGTGWVWEQTLKARDYERAEAERAEEWEAKRERREERDEEN